MRKVSNLYYQASNILSGHGFLQNLTKAERIVPEKADWPSIFAVAQSFNPAIAPLPIRMGRARPNKIGDIPPVAQGNIELLKV